MSKVQLPGSVRFDPHIKMHTGNENKDLSLTQKLKESLEEKHRHNGAIDQVKTRKNIHGKEMDRKKVSCSG